MRTLKLSRISLLQFAEMAKPYPNAISEKLSDIENAVGQLHDQQRVQKFANLTSLLALGEEAWSRKDKFETWTKISDRLLEEDHYYRRLFSGTGVSSNILLEKAYPLDFCVFMLESLATVTAARFQSLFGSNTPQSRLKACQNPQRCGR